MADILTLAMAKKHGGGGSSDAVQYVEQNLTEVQQMQARKNLGLYYEQADSVVIEWDGDTENRTSFSFSEGGMSTTFYKVSDRVLSKNDLVGGSVNISIDGQLSTEDISSNDVIEISGLVMLDSPSIACACLSANAGSYLSGYFVVPEDGTYFALANIESIESCHVQLNLPASETIHKIEEKYLPDQTARFEFNVIHDEESEEMFTTDVPYDEIYEAYINGKVVQCKFTTEDGTAIILSPWYVNEYGMDFQGNHIPSVGRGVDRYDISLSNDSVSVSRWTIRNTINFINGHQFDEFRPWYEYDVGDYCYFGSTMYKCKLAYHGTGEDEYPPDSHFEATNIMAEISAAIGGAIGGEY